MSNLAPQLLPYEQHDLKSFWSQYDLRSPLAECLARAWDFEAGNPGAEGLIAAWRAQFPQWTREQVKIALSLNGLLESVSLGLGTARRVLMDDPGELARQRCLEVRLQWLYRRLREQSSEGTADDDLGLISMAMGVRDIALAVRCLEPRPTARDKDKTQALLERATADAFRCDLDALRSAVELLKKRKPDKSIRWMSDALIGIAERNAEAVVSALQLAVEEENRMRAKKQGRNPVNIEAHDFYRLAERVSPELVAGFDVEQGLCWDAEFHAWTEASPDALKGLDLRPISPLLHEVLIELKLPDWWRALEEPESPWDLCRVVLEAVGPDSAGVHEVVDTWVRLRQWPPVSLSSCPVTVVADLPRHTAFQLRRALLETGASVRLEKTSGA